MKAFLLAAGHGTRLRPLTDHVPKCLLPIQGVPLLKIWLELCRRFEIHEVLLNVHAHGGQISDFVHKQRHDVRVHVVEEQELLGSAGTLRANASWVAREKCFWVLYADVLTCADMDAMFRSHIRRGPDATLAVCRVPNPERCGVVKLADDNTIIEFVEKPHHPATNWAFAGLLLASPQVLSAIPSCHPCDIGFHLLPRLNGSMLAHPVSEYLLDIGTLETYQRAQETWPGLPALETTIS
jgi:mannose-1-phosphate guanylyltransferase